MDANHKFGGSGSTLFFNNIAFTSSCSKNPITWHTLNAVFYESNLKTIKWKYSKYILSDKYSKVEDVYKNYGILSSILYKTRQDSLF